MTTDRASDDRPATSEGLVAIAAREAAATRYEEIRAILNTGPGVDLASQRWLCGELSRLTAAASADRQALSAALATAQEEAEYHQRQRGSTDEILAEAHKRLDAAGIPDARGEPCSDPTCNTRLGHRLSVALERLATARSEARNQAFLDFKRDLDSITGIAWEPVEVNLRDVVARIRAEGFEAGKEAAAKIADDLEAPERWPEGDRLSATEEQAAAEAAYCIAQRIRALKRGDQ